MHPKPTKEQRLRSPAQFGLPAKFDRWRPGQYEAVWASLDSKFRRVGLSMPTGTGKTAAFVAAHAVTGLRTVVLTSTRYQQDQIEADFRSMGLVSIKGQSNYRCRYDVLTKMSKLTVDQGPCHLGITCDKKTDNTCDYFRIRRDAVSADLMVTNYAYWLYTNLYSPQEVFTPDLLVLDEVHDAPAQVCEVLSVGLSQELVAYHVIDEFPRHKDPDRWSTWFHHQFDRVAAGYEAAAIKASKNPTVPNLRAAQRLKKLAQKLERGKGVHLDPWVLRREDKSVVWEPLWPARYAKLLLQGTERVVFVSATLRPKTIEMLGVEKYSIYECDSPFKLANRLIYVVDAPRMTRTADSDDLERWVAIHDAIIEPRLGRNMIIQPHSFERARALRDMSKFSGQMLFHEKRESQGAIVQFKYEGGILVSPSVGTGVDFPGDECRVNIISKVPFPYLGDPVTAARIAEDEDFQGYSTAQDLIQMAGRGVRSEDDWCETFIVDGSFGPFFSRNSKHFPSYFKEAVRFVGDDLPEPPPAAS